jgi:hypothetical protein
LRLRTSRSAAGCASSGNRATGCGDRGGRGGEETGAGTG